MLLKFGQISLVKSSRSNVFGGHIFDDSVSRDNGIGLNLLFYLEPVFIFYTS